jgi:hypothetical protein
MGLQPTIGDIVVVQGFVRDALVVTFYTYRTGPNSMTSVL